MNKFSAAGQRFPLAMVVLLLTAVASVAVASRQYLPMSEYIRRSELVVIADLQKGEDGPLDMVVRVSDVIKGDKTFIGKEIPLRGRILSTADVWLGPDEKGVALLFSRDWEKSDNWPLEEVYREPAQIKTVRTLVDIVAIKDERKRIESLQKLFAGEDPDIQKSTFWELRGMQNSNNFDLLIGWFDELDEKHQAELIELMAQTMGDRRCVPTLIKALFSPALEVRSLAAHGLYFHFPGAPGIAEAFESCLRSEGVTQLAARYLAMRFDNPEYAELTKPRETRWVKAQQLDKAGKADAARKLFFEMIADDAESDYLRRLSVKRLIQDAGPDELTRIRKTSLPFLRKNVSGDNYFFVLDTIRILRALHHPDCLPALIDVFHHDRFVYDAAIRESTMAIYGLGGEARGKAVQKITEILETAPKKQAPGNSAISQLLALVWLADDTELSRARRTMGPVYSQRWTSVAVLAGLENAEDEGAFLISLLKKSETKAIDKKVLEWIVFRLGDLKEKRAVSAIASLVARPYGASPTILKDALTSIGGAEAESEILKLLDHPRSEVRRTATDIICALQGPRSMPLCLKILNGENFGSKTDTLYPIGRYGGKEFLELLERRCDYWNGDRSLTYHGGNAMVQIRERIHHDLNGPIVKAGRFERAVKKSGD